MTMSFRGSNLLTKGHRRNINLFMKKKLLAYGTLTALGLGILGVGTASAHGFFGMNLTPDQIASRQQEQFQKEATLLGISVEDVKNAWAQGKNLQKIADEHGITADQLAQKMKDARTAALKAQLQALVDKGIITQAQMNQRLTFLQNLPNKKGGEMRGKGFGHGFGRGFGF